MKSRTRSNPFSPGRPASVAKRRQLGHRRRGDAELEAREVDRPPRRVDGVAEEGLPVHHPPQPVLAEGRVQLLLSASVRGCIQR